MELAAAALPDSMADRPLDGDFAAAQELLAELALAAGADAASS
jgi:hypothetical protein